MQLSRRFVKKKGTMYTRIVKQVQIQRANKYSFIESAVKGYWNNYELLAEFRIRLEVSQDP